jgi:hypothetical protein
MKAALIVLFLALSGIAEAQCTVDQSQLLTDGGTSERNLPGYYDGQTFTCGISGLLCEIDLMMFNTMTGTMTLNVYKGAGITGSLIATQGVNVNVPTGQVWQNWPIHSTPPVFKDSVYTFQFIPVQGGGLPDPYGVNVVGSDAYSRGYDLTFTQFDMTFKTYVESSTGIYEAQSEDAMDVYPNPAHDKITVSVPFSFSLVNCQLSIVNLMGQQVYSTSINRQHESINCNLPAGIYFVKITDGNRVGVKKLVVE